MQNIFPPRIILILGLLTSMIIGGQFGTQTALAAGQAYSQGSILNTFAADRPPGAVDKCGGGDTETWISININCTGRGVAILDAFFAIIRFLSFGAGLVIVGSIVVGGIQYTASRGDPQATAQAVNRLRSALIALLIFIFAYAILNYLVPGQILR